LTKNITDKDKKAWQDFIDSPEKLEVKDKEEQISSKLHLERSIDLHGHTLEQANQKIFEFINKCYNENISKINVITGKGLRSKNVDNPYQSSDLSILKHSVPNYIKNNSELMSKILKIDFEAVESLSKGNFDIILKKNGE